MNKNQAIERLNYQILQIEGLKQKKRRNPDFKKWHLDTEILIQKVFGENNRHIKDFNDISYFPMILTSDTTDYDLQEAYTDGLNNAHSVLASLIREAEEYWEEEKESSAKIPVLDQLELLCSRYHLVARQMQSRYNNRGTLRIEDEYDVQDLFHTLLCLFFDDIRPEEWTPSYAGGCSRVDFLLKQEEMIVEIKKTRKGLAAKEVGEQLLIDIQKYKAHPSCRTLVCFVYDPEGCINNPKGIENDLNQETDDFKVKVHITPRGT